MASSHALEYLAYLVSKLSMYRYMYLNQMFYIIFLKNFLQTVYYFFFTRLEKEQELCFPVENKNDYSCVPSPDGWRRQKNCLRRQRPVKQTPSIKRLQHYIRSLSITSIRVKIICPCKLVVLIMLMLCTLWKATVRISSLLQHCSIIP